MIGVWREGGEVVLFSNLAPLWEVWDGKVVGEVGRVGEDSDRGQRKVKSIYLVLGRKNNGIEEKK